MEAATASGVDEGPGCRIAQGILCLMVFALPLAVWPPAFDLFDGTKRMVAHGCVLLALVAWGADQVLLDRVRIRLGALHGGFMIFLLSQLPGALGAVNGELALDESLNRFLWLVTLVLGTQLFHERRAITILAGSTVLGGAVSASLGMLQAGGLDVSIYPQVAVPAASFGNKNMAGEYLGLVAVLAAWLAISARRPGARMAAGAALGLLATYILYAINRGTWVAAGVASAAAVLVVLALPGLRAMASRLDRAILKDLGPSLAMGVFLALAVRSAGERAVPAAPVNAPLGVEVKPGTRITTREIRLVGFDLSTFSVNWRFAVWANSLALARDHALFGVGPGNWRVWYPRYFREVAEDRDFNSKVQADSPHNDYLQYLGEAGLVGMAGLFVLAASLIAGFLGRIRASVDLDGPASRGQDSMGQDSRGQDSLGQDSVDQGTVRQGTGGEAAWSATLTLAVFALVTLFATTAVFSFPVQKAAPSFLVFLWLGLGPGNAPGIERRWLGPSRTFAPVLLAGLLLVLLARAELREFRADQSFKTGLTLFNEGRVEDAWNVLREAHGLHPGNHALAVFAGGMAMELGLIDEAIVLNRRALASHPHFTNAWNQLGNALLKKGDLDASEQAYREALAIHPELMEPLRNLATLLLSRNRLPEALPLLETLTRRYPADPRNRLDLAEIYRATGRFGHARELYEHLQTELPRDPVVPLGLGDVARRMGRNEESERHILHAIWLAPDDPRAHLALGRLLTATGRSADAQLAFQKAMSLSPDDTPAQIELAESLRRSGDPEGAIDLLDRLVQKYPGRSLLHSRLAHAHLAAQDRRQAAEHFKLAVTLDPRRADDWAKLGRLQVEAGFEPAARATFEQALRTNPDHSAILNELGMILNREGQTEEAVDLFRRACAQPRPSPEIYFNLGAALVRLGRPAEAVPTLETFLTLWRGDDKYRDMAAAELARLKGTGS